MELHRRYPKRNLDAGNAPLLHEGTLLRQYRTAIRSPEGYNLRVALHRQWSKPILTVAWHCQCLKGYSPCKGIATSMVRSVTPTIEHTASFQRVTLEYDGIVPFQGRKQTGTVVAVPT